MGLDMYLYLKKYEGCSNYDKDFETKVKGFYPPELGELAELQLQRNFLSKETQYQVGYWRKANAIHKWFVDHCADGKDDCQPVYVSIEQLKDLIELAKSVLEDHSLAKAVLPAQDGFFFGSTEYDEWYFNELKNTVAMLQPILDFLVKQEAERKRGEYGYSLYYEASW